MAILSAVPGLVVTIDVDGQDLAEYDDEEADDNPFSCTKYIEVQSGAGFGIARRYDARVFQQKDHAIYFKICADGNRLTQVRDDPRAIGRVGARYVRDYASVVTGRSKFHQHLLFGELQMSEGKADQALFGQLGDLGTITVKCYRVRVEERERIDDGDESPSNRSHRRRPEDTAREAAARQSFQALLKDDVIPEKNLKGMAISHQAKLGQPVEQKQRIQAGGPAHSIVFLDRHPLAKFNLKYRSRSALQGLCVIPRTPEPVPLEDRPIEDLSPDEMRELLRRQRPNVKQEVKRERGQSDPEAVETRPPKARKTSPSQGLEVIDLSGD